MFIKVFISPEDFTICNPIKTHEDKIPANNNIRKSRYKAARHITIITTKSKVDDSSIGIAAINWKIPIIAMAISKRFFSAIIVINVGPTNDEIVDTKLKLCCPDKERAIFKRDNPQNIKI
ncbi:MAG: hypothetical protein N3B21_07735 [Clostridia bacterium]|nr:hypothetical protein [Clostridia bacterium]